MVGARFTALAFALASVVSSSPCPFGQMFEDGKLSSEESAKFLAARDGGEEAVESMMHFSSKTARTTDDQNEFYKRQVSDGLLSLGGGLLNGQLQPFTGKLKLLRVPKRETFSLKIIPDAAHPFKAPTSSDVRGMCPTLNTMANHGFINRNGITTFAQGAEACQITLGFGYDTCVFLSALGLISGGDLITGLYSIGGMDSRVPNTLGPSLGISHHGPFEIDESISRQDTYFGNNADFQLKRFNRIRAIAAKNGGEFGIETWAEERAASYTESRDSNPEFDAGPKQLAVALAERVFIFRALPNGTFLGRADNQNVLPFYLNETFPANWFRRPTPYNLDNVGTDIVDLYALYPTEIGENQGFGNFIPAEIDFGQLDAEAAQCFLLTQLLDVTPGIFSTAITKNYDLAKAFMQGAIVPFFAGKGCTMIYTQPGASAGTTIPGSSTTANWLVNGRYQAGS